MKNELFWCLGCNYVSLGKRCPSCRSEAAKVRSSNGRLVPAFKPDIDAIRTAADIFGEGCGKELIPDANTVILGLKDNGDADVISYGAVIAQYVNKKVVITLAGMKVMAPKIRKFYVRCDHDSAHFVKMGRNLMASGISEAGPFAAGDRLAIFDERGAVIAMGIAKMSSEEIDSADRGVAVKVKGSDPSRYAQGKQKRSWKESVDVNSAILTTKYGDSIKNIRNLSSTYGCPVVIEMTDDIRSTARLLLVLNAGLTPSVQSPGSEFIDFQMEKYSLKAFDPKGGRRMVITDRKDSEDPDEILHDPIEEWDDISAWMYVMRKAEPFDTAYMRGLLS